MNCQLKFAFRITHIQNIPHILDKGFVCANSIDACERYVPIGDKAVITRRNEQPVKGFNLKEYIPFYFGPRSPMLYVVQHGFNGTQRINAEEIVYCVVRIDDIRNNDIECIFTDGHALSGLTVFYDKSHLHKLDYIINHTDVFASYWNSESDPDLKRRKEAEFLIKKHLPPQYIRGFVVYNNKAMLRLLEMGIDQNKIIINPAYYF